MLQGANNMADRGRPERTLSSLASAFEATGDGRPGWLTGDLLEQIVDRFRRVQGQWRATPFHETLELEFPQRGTAPIR
jgi:hypothetical protein